MGEQCAVYGKTVEQAIETALTVWEKQRKVHESPFISGLMSEWMLDKIENPLKPLRPRSQKSIRFMANTYKADFKDARINEIDQTRIERYLREKDVSNQTRKNLRNYLGQFFNWAVRRGLYDKNPVKDIEIHVQNGVLIFQRRTVRGNFEAGAERGERSDAGLSSTTMVCRSPFWKQSVSAKGPTRKP